MDTQTKSQSCGVEGRSRARRWRVRVGIGSTLVLLLLACGSKSRSNPRDKHDNEQRGDAAADGGTRSDGRENNDGGQVAGEVAPNPENADAGQSASTGADTLAPSDSTQEQSSVGGEETSDSESVDSDPTSSGSSSSNSSVDSTSEPVLPTLPEGCEPRQQVDKEESCSLGVECGATSDAVNCSRLESGRWECGCTFYHKDRVYELDGVQGLEACAAAFSLCNDAPLQLGDEVCGPLATTNENDCALQLSCGRPIAGEFGSEVSARLMEVSTAQCVRSSAGDPFNCECAHLDTQVTHGALTDSAAEACAASAAFCRGEEASPIDAPETCVVDSELAGADSCELVQTCTTPVGVIEDVTITDIAPRGSYCTPTGPTTSRCYCAGIDSTFSFEVNTSDSSCETTSLNCSTGVEVEATDDPSCMPTSQTTADGSCWADLDCTQPATVDGRPILAEGRLVVYCRQAALGEPWWCSCASDQESAVFEYGEPDAMAWDVCAAAPSGCQERMPIHLGAYGEYRDPVDPLQAEGQ